jgi:hypothetical protein
LLNKKELLKSNFRKMTGKPGWRRILQSRTLTYSGRPKAK